MHSIDDAVTATCIRDLLCLRDHQYIDFKATEISDI